MADFNLTQTDQQVQNILNDGQGAMGASAQTTLTTEYVMLKDTSGIYHKILKSSFTEAIRDVLAGLLVNNDKGTTINQIAAIASGDFGSITPANLASVLGVFLTHDSVTDVDLDTFITPGFNAYRVNLSNAQEYETYHFPIRDSGAFLITINSDSNVGFQIYVSSSQNVGTFCARKKWGGNYSAWSTIL